MIIDYMAKRFKTVIMGYIVGILILCAADARTQQTIPDKYIDPPYEVEEVDWEV